MEKLLIVDGHNLLFQMFYGMPSRIVTNDGKQIQGVMGFVGGLIKIIQTIAPSHVVVLFDGEHENFRTRLNPEYKKNRIDYSAVAENENPFSQLEYVYKALDIMGITYYEENEYEVDDVIASYVCRYGKQVKIVISSFDSDYFQLINDNVTVFRYRGIKSVLCDKNYIFEKYGILPEFYADFKSLTGDSADNIKGAENIGAKTAMKLINLFGGITEIILNNERIENVRIRASVISNIQRLKNNYQLIKLNDVGKVPFDLNSLVYTYNGLTTQKVLEKVGLIIK